MLYLKSEEQLYLISEININVYSSTGISGRNESWNGESNNTVGMIM